MKYALLFCLLLVLVSACESDVLLDEVVTPPVEEVPVGVGPLSGTWESSFPGHGTVTLVISQGADSRVMTGTWRVLFSSSVDVGVLTGYLATKKSGDTYEGLSLNLYGKTCFSRVFVGYSPDSKDDLEGQFNPATLKKDPGQCINGVNGVPMHFVRVPDEATVG